MKKSILRLISTMLVFSLTLVNIASPVVAATPCKHQSYQDYYCSSSFVGKNDSQHKVKHTYNRVCEDCGKTVKQTYEYKFIDHNFDANGKCECGYQYKCSHKKYEDFYKSSTYVSKTSSQHKIKHIYDRVCKDCGKIVKQTYEYKFIDHSFDANGKCECGYQYKCNHKNYKDFYKSSTYVSKNNNQHRIKHIYDRVCKDCGKTVKPTYEYKWLEHKFNSVGECECGYSKTQCKHTKYQELLVSSQYVSSNKTKHQIKEIYDRICKDCGKIIKQVSKTKWENHVYNSDEKCTCSYENPEVSKVGIVSYSVELDESQDYVTIKVVGNSNTTAITIGLKDSTKAIDSINVQSRTAKAEFKIPYSEKEVKYTVLIMVYGKDTTDFVRVNESFKANNPKTLWDWITEGTKNLSSTTLGVIEGITVGGFVEPVVLVADLVDCGLNAFDKEQYERNKKWRADLVESIENFIVDKLPDDQAYYYYCGTFGGRVADLAVGAVALFNGAKGIIKSVLSYDDGVKVLHVALDNGDEALMMLSDKSDDVVMLSSKLDDAVEGIAKLSPYDLTPTHSLTLSAKQYTKLKETIRLNGITDAIKYVEYDGVKYVVDGHHRLRIAKELKIAEIPVEEVKLPYKGYQTINDLLWWGD